MSGDCDSVPPGTIRFYDNYVPALEVGDYLVNVTQRVNPTTGGIDECYTASQPFSVAGPKYALPAGELFSVFPPSEATGVFDQFLPHMVLAARELPWERNAFGDVDLATQTPWLALLVFGADETDVLLAPSVRAWTPNRTMTASIPVPQLYDHPTGDGILWPAIAEEWYEQGVVDSLSCTVIDVAALAWGTVVPGKDALRQLAHARQVDPTAKDESVLKVAGDGWYSVVVAGRMPARPAGDGTPARSIAHLVSLDGLAQYAGGTLPEGTQRVRMIALASWTFTCLPELGGGFAELVDGLLRDGTAAKSTTFALPLPPPLPDAPPDPATAYATGALAAGYVPLRWRTRLGEESFGWYRGPFSPVAVTEFASGQRQGAQDPAGWAPFGTASAALAYDPAHGMFDLSYAVAWETGRLLALSDGAFGRRLVAWRHAGQRLLDLILERGAQVPALQGLDPANPDAATEASLLDLLQPYAVTGDFVAYLVAQLAQQLAPQLAVPVPPSPDPPLPPYPAPPTPVADPTTIAGLLTQPDVQQAILDTGGEALEAIGDWLARRYVLDGVPFDALVPSAGLLPPESIRFFHLDANWLEALLEGAVSVGIDSSRDRLFQDLVKDLVWNTALTAVAGLRARLLGQAPPPPAPGPPPPAPALAGMLLRSQLVSGWPGLEVHAYEQPSTSSTEIPLLRMQRLAVDVLLCLWPAVPAAVTVDEPQEGVAFGFEDPPVETDTGRWLYLRSVDPSSYGVPMCTDAEIDAGTCAFQLDVDAAGLVDSATRVVQVGALASAISQKLPGAPALAVRDLATQLVKVPEQGLFVAPGGGG